MTHIEALRELGKIQACRDRLNACCRHLDGSKYYWKIGQTDLFVPESLGSDLEN